MGMRKATARLTLALVLGVLAAVMGGGWLASEWVRELALEPRLRDSRRELRVDLVEEDRIALRLPQPPGAGPWIREGIWGLRWEGGYGQVGRILEVGERSVVREFQLLTGKLRAGDAVKLFNFAFPDDPAAAFGLEYEEVLYASPIGKIPAWRIPGERDPWLILVHGKREAPGRTALRASPALPIAAELGLPILVISYRNDVGAPRSQDGLHRYGETEWEDLQGAVAYALEQGAGEVVLMGYSMGGAIILSFLQRSSRAERVTGVILDSPMVDAAANLRFRAQQSDIPAFLVSFVKGFSGLRFGIDWAGLDYLQGAARLHVPLLLFHGDADEIVPIETSDALINRWGGDLAYVPIRDATHIRAWNLNPSLYEKQIREFLAARIR